MDYSSIKTLGQLKASGYTTQSVKDEIRTNLMSWIREGKSLPGIIGYEDSVIPQLESALLAKHNVLFLGLRGQAKTRIARSITQLMDEQIPVIEGSSLREDPFHPITKESIDKADKLGDDLPIVWQKRGERYGEKLATPDVSIADLIGDLDPIKASNLGVSFDDPRAIHFGLIPRAHRGIFVINELPDLQPRIQVGLFNILQEEDIQIRGFNLRLPLDILFVFTANPEDYTNRGSIVTPLKDRIESQIVTHYPKSIAIGRAITDQEVRLSKEQEKHVHMPDAMKNLIERIAFVARESEFIDEKSGVSARLTIALRELTIAAAERRALQYQSSHTSCRIQDLYTALPAMLGKVELVYEGEQEGAQAVALKIISEAIRLEFMEHFDLPNKASTDGKNHHKQFNEVVQFFSDGKEVELPRNISDEDLRGALVELDGLLEIASTVEEYDKAPTFWLEFVLHGMAEHSLISKDFMTEGHVFGDLLQDMLSQNPLEGFEDFGDE